MSKTNANELASLLLEVSRRVDNVLFFTVQLRGGKVTFYKVEFSHFAAKQMKRIPFNIRETVFLWKKSVEELGLHKVRQVGGFRDEALKGSRLGQRSIRLNRAYRLIYDLSEAEEVIVVGVLEVNKHDY